MATVGFVSTMIQHSVLQTVWTLTDADTGLPENLSRFPNHSVQISGTFGSGPATVVLEGSDDGVTYFTLKDAQGSSISATSAIRVDTIPIVPKFIRARSSGGQAGVTSVTVTVTSRSFGH